MNKFLVTVALGAIAVSAGAAAQAPGGGRGQRDQTRAEVQQRADMFFQMMDANHDGTVTKAEAQQALASFGAADAGAGASPGRMGMMQRMVDRLFATTPSVTQQQLEALMLARFDAQDLNHDGTVTAAEREQSRAARSGAAAAPAGTTTPTQAQ